MDEIKFGEENYLQKLKIIKNSDIDVTPYRYSEPLKTQHIKNLKFHKCFLSLNENKILITKTIEGQFINSIDFYGHRFEIHDSLIGKFEQIIIINFKKYLHEIKNIFIESNNTKIFELTGSYIRKIVIPSYPNNGENIFLPIPQINSLCHGKLYLQINLKSKIPEMSLQLIGEYLNNVQFFTQVPLKEDKFLEYTLIAKIIVKRFRLKTFDNNCKYKDNIIEFQSFPKNFINNYGLKSYVLFKFENLDLIPTIQIHNDKLNVYKENNFKYMKIENGFILILSLEYLKNENDDSDTKLNFKIILWETKSNFKIYSYFINENILFYDEYFISKCFIN